MSVGLYSSGVVCVRGGESKESRKSGRSNGGKSSFDHSTRCGGEDDPDMIMSKSQKTKRLGLGRVLMIQIHELRPKGERNASRRRLPICLQVDFHPLSSNGTKLLPVLFSSWCRFFQNRHEIGGRSSLTGFVPIVVAILVWTAIRGSAAVASAEIA